MIIRFFIRNNAHSRDSYAFFRTVIPNFLSLKPLSLKPLPDTIPIFHMIIMAKRIYGNDIISLEILNKIKKKKNAVSQIYLLFCEMNHTQNMSIGRHEESL